MVKEIKESAHTFAHTRIQFFISCTTLLFSNVSRVNKVNKSLRAKLLDWDNAQLQLLSSILTIPHRDTSVTIKQAISPGSKWHTGTRAQLSNKLLLIDPKLKGTISSLFIQTGNDYSLASKQYRVTLSTEGIFLQFKLMLDH